ncbi:MAG: hypothetical protein ABI054_11005 [Planctomycetota bacterium]
MALEHHEGRHVLVHPRHPADVGVGADGHEMVRGCRAGNVRALADETVACEQHAVGHDHAIAHVAVVSDVRAGHEQAVARDARDPAAFDRAAVDRDELADRVPVADLELRRLVLVRKVLGRAAEVGLADHDVVRAERGDAVDHHVGPELGAIADAHGRADHTVRTDHDVEAELGVGVDDCGGVDLSGHESAARARRRSK